MQLNTLAADIQNLLDQFAAALAETTIPGFTVPPTQYVASGLVAWDGESLTAYVGSIGAGLPGLPEGRGYVTAVATQVWATVYVQIIRETAGLEDWSVTGGRIPIPPPETLGEYGQMAATDAAALIQAAIAVHGAYSVTGPGEEFIIDGVAPLGPDGGLSAQRLTLKLALA